LSYQGSHTPTKISNLASMLLVQAECDFQLTKTYMKKT